MVGESKKKAVLALIGGSLATFWPGALCFGYPGVLGPYWRETFEVGTADTGNIMFFMLASLGIFMFLVGRWQERLGLRTMVVIGGILCGVNMLTAAYANGMAMVYLWAFVTGAASCFTNMPALTAVQRWFPGRRGLVSGIVNLVFGSAAAIASPALARMLSGMGYLSMNLVLGAVALVTGIAASVLISDPTRLGLQPIAGGKAAKVAMPGPSLTVREALRTRDFWLIWLTWATVGAAPIAMVTQSVNYGLSQGVELQTAVIILTAFNLTNGLSRILTGYFSDRIRRNLTMAVAFALAGVAYFILPHTSGIAIAAVLAAFVGFALGTLFAVSAPLVADHFGLRHFGAIFGMVFTAYGFLAGPLGPWLSGFIVDAGGGSYVPVFSYLGGMCLLGAVFISLVGRGRKA